MKRRTVFKLLLFLLAGAIINVAVAWAPFLRLTEVSPVPTCSRAWPFEGEFGPEVGTVLNSSFDWWLPVDCEEACHRPGQIHRLFKGLFHVGRYVGRRDCATRYSYNRTELAFRESWDAHSVGGWLANSLR